MDIGTLIKHHPLSSFFGLVFLFTWIWWGALFIIKPAGPQGSVGVPLLIYTAWGAPLVGPALVGILLTVIVGGKEGLWELLGRLKRWRIGVAWYAVALLITPLIAIIVLVILAATVSPSFLPAVPHDVALLLLVPIAGGVSSFLEEVGWTGFAIPRLLARHRALIAGLVLGVLWGTWHIPINIWTQSPRFDTLAIITYLIGSGTSFVPLVAYRVLIVWVYVNSKGSLLLGWIMHWSFIAGLNVLVAPPSAIQVVQFYAVFTVALWIIVAIVVAIFGARTLSRGEWASARLALLDLVLGISQRKEH
jgi:membrane protease YdiL (CAAX protease family)